MLLNANPTSNNAPSKGPINYDRMNQLQRQGQLKIVGAPSEQDLNAMKTEATQLEENEATRKVYQDSFNKLNKMVLAGKFQPAYRAAEINTLSGQLAHQTVKRYNADEAHNQAEGMFPSPADILQPGVRAEKYRKAMQFFDSQEAGVPTLTRFGILNKKQAPPQAKFQDGQTGTYKGQPVIWQNGKWNRK